MTAYNRNLAIEEIKEKLKTEENQAEKERLEKLLDSLYETFEE
jgi:hypothetical protein